MKYGNKLNPKLSLRTAHGIKGTRQKIIVTHNPSEIDQKSVSYCWLGFPTWAVMTSLLQVE